MTFARQVLPEIGRAQTSAAKENLVSYSSNHHKQVRNIYNSLTSISFKINCKTKGQPEIYKDFYINTTCKPCMLQQKIWQILVSFSDTLWIIFTNFKFDYLDLCNEKTFFLLFYLYISCSVSYIHNVWLSQQQSLKIDWISFFAEYF